MGGHELSFPLFISAKNSPLFFFSRAATPPLLFWVIASSSSFSRLFPQRARYEDNSAPLLFIAWRKKNTTMLLLSLELIRFKSTPSPVDGTRPNRVPPPPRPIMIPPLDPRPRPTGSC